jgi:hypothetical protein
MNMNLLAEQIRMDPRIELAKTLTHEAVMEYKILKSQLKADQSINLVCIIGGVQYDVYNVGVNNGIVSVVTQAGKTSMRLLCPIEQISFAVILSEKTSQTPPREIGYKAIEEDHKKSAE